MNAITRYDLKLQPPEKRKLCNGLVVSSEERPVQPVPNSSIPQTNAYTHNHLGQSMLSQIQPTFKASREKIPTHHDKSPHNPQNDDRNNALEWTRHVNATPYGVMQQRLKQPQGDIHTEAGNELRMVGRHSIRGLDTRIYSLPQEHTIQLMGLDSLKNLFSIWLRSVQDN